MTVAVYIETGQKKVFVSAYDWPGWSRGAKTEGAALEALATYAPRYAAIASVAGRTLPSPTFAIIDRIAGSGTTDFGVPHELAPRDTTRITKDKAGELADLVQAAWSSFDAGVAVAPPTLAKGPRGGGRDRDKVVEHVLAAEQAYAAKLGLKLSLPPYSDPLAVKAFRDAIVEVLRAAGPPAPKRWPVRYATRRIAWHVLDHLWEIEDKSVSG